MPMPPEPEVPEAAGEESAPRPPESAEDGAPERLGEADPAAERHASPSDDPAGDAEAVSDEALDEIPAGDASSTAEEKVVSDSDEAGDLEEDGIGRRSEDARGAGLPAEPAGSDGTAPGDPAAPTSPEALRIAEALVFASATPVTAARLAPLLPAGTEAAATLAALARSYEGRGVQLVNLAGGYAFRTAEDLAPALTRVVEVPRRLPRVAMEALAIIAWHQPVTRAEIEEIRGTALSQTTLETLLENGLVAPRGKKEAPGRPTLWATTPRFLEQFGLASLRDLPRREELMPEPGLPLPEPAPSAG